MGLLISYSLSLQRNCDPESSSWKTLWLHEEAEWRDPGLHLDPFCDPSSAWTWWAFRAHPPAFTSRHFFPRSDWNCDSVWLQGRHWRSFKWAFTGLTFTGLTQNWFDSKLSLFSPYEGSLFSPYEGKTSSVFHAHSQNYLSFAYSGTS